MLSAWYQDLDAVYYVEELLESIGKEVEAVNRVRERTAILTTYLAAYGVALVEMAQSIATVLNQESTPTLGWHTWVGLALVASAVILFIYGLYRVGQVFNPLIYRLQVNVVEIRKFLTEYYSSFTNDETPAGQATLALKALIPPLEADFSLNHTNLLYVTAQYFHLVRGVILSLPFVVSAFGFWKIMELFHIAP
jgi:hypothetical protein